MKKSQLTKDEEIILKNIEKGKYKSRPNLKSELEKYRQYATNTFKKNKNINIRLSEQDILKLKSRALENGLPYQTLISIVLHKFANNKINISI